MNDSNIGFIGAGNMATALVKGLLANGHDPAQLILADTDQEKLDALESECGVKTVPDSQALVQAVDTVVLAVKPQVCQQVLTAVRVDLKQHSPLLISIAAGITVKQLTQWSHPEQALIRCMPNTPALVQAGASALFANAQCTQQQRQQAGEILTAVGEICWLEREQDMDAVTALSGSGPAYFFLLMEAMQEAAEKLGLARETARHLCLQTAFGAARLAQSSDVDVAELRRRVTSPGGTTEAALNQFDRDHFREIVERALEKAAERSRELAQ